jgi:hypothetical protein
MRIEAAVLVDGIDRLAQRHAGGEIERQRDRRELALVVDRQEGRVRGVELDEGRQRHHLAVTGDLM